MSRSDDLQPLLTGSPPTAIGFRQGVVVSWDPVTYANYIQVGTALLYNLPVFTSTDAALIAEGDTVTILTFGTTWAILGRFTVPPS